MTNEKPRVIAVRHGSIVPDGSWLYAWIDAYSGEVAYVGATGFDPELRAHLHMTSPDPTIARVKTRVPNALERDFNVLVFPLPAGASRPQHKHAVKRALSEFGLVEVAAEDDDVFDDLNVVLVAEITETVRRYVELVRGGSNGPTGAQES